MFKKCLTCLIAIILMVTFSYATNYESTWEEALQKATLEDKPLLIVMYSNQCGWCKKLETDILQDHEVSELTANFICVRINVKEREDVTKKFLVRGVPMVILMSTKVGYDRVFILGYLPKEQFIECLKTDLINLRRIERGEL